MSTSFETDAADCDRPNMAQSRLTYNLPWIYALAGMGLSVTAAAVGLAVHGWDDGWLFATRWTARVSLILFVLAYAGAFVVPAGATGRIAAMFRDSRGLGWAFATSHVVHAVAFCTYLVRSGVSRSLVSTIGGTIGYLVLAMMLAASLGPMRCSAALWRWGMRYLWLIFAFSYLGRVMEYGDRFGEGVFGLAMLVAVILVRITRRRIPASFRSRM